MGWFRHSHEKSLFGQLLVRQKLISEEQLAQAIAHQRTTGQRLGDILAEWDLLTHHHIRRVLRKQRQLRLAAAIVAALFAPLDALAVAPVPVFPIGAQTAQQRVPAGWLAFTEDELGTVSAQGLSEGLLQHFREKGDGVKVLGKLVAAMNPVLDFLEADVTIKDVVYNPARATAAINPDGSITLSMPSSIGEINFDNIHVKGDRPGASFGSISIRRIDLSGTTLTLSVHRR